MFSIQNKDNIINMSINWEHLMTEEIKQKYKNVERTIGTTKWSMWGLFKYALDGITSFSVTPLRFVAVLGFIISLLSLIYILVN